MDIAYIAAGFFVGGLVGLTGVGGGSLMTPLLIFGFGVPPLTAVGTDLVFAALTKASGVVSHWRLKHIRGSLVALLLLGSAPSAILSLTLLDHMQDDIVRVEGLIHVMLGVALIMTAVSLVWRGRVQALGYAVKRNWPGVFRLRPLLTVLLGCVLGILVPVSSIGAGALGAAALMLLYPGMPTRRIVGTDLAHAVPLTAIAGIGHWQMGSVDPALLSQLLMGSLPGIWLGTHLGSRVPERFMRPTLAGMLMLIGVKFITV